MFKLIVKEIYMVNECEWAVVIKQDIQWDAVTRSTHVSFPLT